MAQGVKETKEIVVFVVALANFLVENAGKSPIALLPKIGEVVGLLQMMPTAVAGADKALEEIVDGFTQPEKEEIFVEIVKVKASTAPVEQVIESGLKAAVALTDLIAVLRGKKAA